MTEPMIELEDVAKSFDGGATHAVEGVNLTIEEGGFVVLVGGSGSGKTTTLKMINGLIRPDRGQIRVGGEAVGAAPPHILRRRIGYVFQEIGLFPHLSVAENIGITPMLMGESKTAIEARVAELLDLVSLPRDFATRRPSALSGGQRQRVAIARALAVRPRVLIADEPVSMLDVSIRLGVLNLLAELRDEERLAILYVTHDIASARYLADTIVVMYAGQLVESAPSATLTDSPAHPYTQLLLSAAPDPDRVTPPHLEGRGAPPSLSAPPSGCRFHPRCPFVMDICKREVPPSIAVSPGHVAACWLHVDPAERGGGENGVLATPSASMENEIKR